LLLLLTNCAVCVVAPTPRFKTNRVLKTAIPPVNVKSLPGSVGELEVLVQGTKAQGARADAFVAEECQRDTTVPRATQKLDLARSSQNNNSNKVSLP